MAKTFVALSDTREDDCMQQSRMAELNAFFCAHEKKAYHVTFLSTRNREDALDIVQDVMCRFVQKYASKPSEEWRPLFYRMLHNKTMDHHRRNKWLKWTPWSQATSTEAMPELQAPGDTPDQWLQQQGQIERLESALSALPARQREAFLLRNWEGLSVQQTAFAMRCSEGSVKTHVSRALEKLTHCLEK